MVFRRRLGEWVSNDARGVLFFRVPSAESYDALQSALRNAIDRATSSGDISRAGVYVRSLSSGLWTSVNGDDEFYPASLMKIVTLMTYLRSADSDPSILDTKITVTSAEAVVEQNLLPEQSAVAGRTYTVAELLRLLIVYSDNVASNTLVNHIVPSSLNVVLADLQIPQYADNTMYQISPRFYSRLLRILYNSTPSFKGAIGVRAGATEQEYVCRRACFRN